MADKQQKSETEILKSLRQLVGEATALNPVFKEKYDYWVRRRRVNVGWLFKQLEIILGRERIMAELKRMI